MTDLQLGLLVVGAAAVVAVVVYNRLQERKARRDVERAFAAARGDALFDPAAAEIKHPVKAAARPPDRHSGGLPDPRVDYIVDLEIERGTLSATVLENWRPFEHRFARRAFLAGSDGARWSDVVAGDVRSLTALRAALQMVSRSGVASDAEVLEFRSAADTLAAALGARVSAPDSHAAVAQARELDQFCADNDIQVALHVVGGTLADRASLVLDVPRSDDAHGFEALCREARDLAAKHGARVVDDNGNPLDEHALLAIATEIDTVRARLAAAGIEPGSALALRLFS